MSMSNPNEALFHFIQLGLTYSVCFVVWIMLLIGLGQYLRDIYNQIRPARKSIRRLFPSHQVSH